MMTTSPQQIEDGNLPEALRGLGDAISKLIDPKPQAVDNRIHWIDSLYDQLTDGIPGGQGNASRVAQSSPPICIDANELKNEIDTAVGAWEPRGADHYWLSGPPYPVQPADINELAPLTILRLKAIEKRSWRPQDVRSIDQIIANLQAWCESIKSLLNPAPRWHLPNPCPACNTAVVYRKNSGGESVRQPALQIGAAGCVCQNCHHTWAPEYFRHLANVLGYKLPEGVLE